MPEVEEAVLRLVRIPFLHFFETSFGRVHEKDALLLELRSGGFSGWGESVASEGPFYSYEDHNTAWYILTSFLLPQMIQNGWDDPLELSRHFNRIRGHRMAKATIESALWDLKAKSLQEPLFKLLGGTRSSIQCGVSIGIQDSVDDLLRKIDLEVQSGYQKIKIKIKPGWDVEIVEIVRTEYPGIALMVDANSAYTLEDLPILQKLDQYDLLMIEQPLYHDDIFEHSWLQKNLVTPICLDESIRHCRDAQFALEIGACRIINIKMGRVGGHGEAIRIHDLCAERGVPVWCGGMLETGIGRAHNVALSTLPNFSIPGDVSASQRYFDRDTIVPPVEVSSDGQITVPDLPGIGYQPDTDWIERITVRKARFTRGSGGEVNIYD